MDLIHYILILVLVIIIAIIVKHLYNNYNLSNLGENYLGGSNDSYISVHICGPPGSGKTFAGNQLSKKLGNKAIVIDLDYYTILEDNIEGQLQKDFNDGKSEDYISKKFYEMLVSDRINKVINDNIDKKNVIFVGLPNIIIDQKFYNIDLSDVVDLTLYIKSPLNKIINQRFNRDILNGFCLICKDKKIQDNIIKGKMYMPQIGFSKESIKMGVIELEKIYVDNFGYKQMSQDQIIKFVLRQAKKK